MSDLVKRLQRQAAFNPYNTDFVEAAARIEALEAALRERDELIRLMRRSGSRKPNPQPNLRGSAALAPECIHSWSAPFDGMVKCTKCGSVLAEEQDK